MRLSDIRGVAIKHPGMWDEFLSAGTIGSDRQTLEISREQFDAINVRHFGKLAFGTVLHEVLKPVAKAIDRVAGTKLSNCGGCGKRQLKLNSMILLDKPINLP